MIREIQAKTLLATVKSSEGWFGVRYNMNIYRGCEHRCVYCDSRSECYGMTDFDGELLVKANAIELLEKELSSKRIRGCIGTGAMSDPYTPAEAQYNLTGRALEVIARRRFGIHITTKSDLILRDLPTLTEISKVWASVSFTITTPHDDLARKLEPLAPPPSARLAAMKAISEAGIVVGVTMMPILPFIEDDPDDIRLVVRQAAESGATYIVPWFGVTLRDRQREHFYTQLDRHSPGLRRHYQSHFGPRYFCEVRNPQSVESAFTEECAKYGLQTRPEDVISVQGDEQLSLF